MRGAMEICLLKPFRLFKQLLNGYSSFFGLNHPASKLLLLFCTMLHPQVGIMGLLGGLFVIASRRILSFASENNTVEIINGILLGMLVGSTFAIDDRALAILFCGSFLIVLASAVLTDTLTRTWRLPLLGLPYVIAGYAILPIAASVNLPHVPLSLASPLFSPPVPGANYLFAIGSIYFNGTAFGGAITFLAIFLSSRYLALLALASAIACTWCLQLLHFPSDSLLFLVAQMNGVLSACVLGGLYTVPGKRSIIVALVTAALTAMLTISLHRILWQFELPVLALPFVISTYAALTALHSQRGGPWSIFWLTRPNLPEISIEQIQLCEARGDDSRSIALRAPFSGTWQVYQGVDGKHTHQGIWRNALDFFQTEDGLSYSGSGVELANYHCFGKPVLSPAYGRIFDCADDKDDNAPGLVDTRNNWGNFIVIALDCGLFVVLAHLQKHSLKVSRGDRIQPGQLLALCGNSGRSPQPHLHMHVQDAPQLGSRTVPFHLTCVEVASPAHNIYKLNARPRELDVLTVPLRNAALKRALQLDVGKTYRFLSLSGGSAPRILELQVVLDVYGQFYLQSESGARAAFVASDDLVAFFGRQGAPDRLLDLFACALGLTPLTEGTTYWQDLVPIRLLPLPRALKIFLSLCDPFTRLAHSSYERSWDAYTKTWVQRGRHQVSGMCGLLKWTCLTTARLCESEGVIDLEVRANGARIQKATLAGHGIREDNGIPERTSYRLPST